MSPVAKASESAPSLIDSLEEYLSDVPREGRADALHQVFYGFYTRVAVIDRTTYELAEWAKTDAAEVAGTTGTLAEALRDNALFVGQDLFAGRMRAMSAMGYIAKRLVSLLNGAPPPTPVPPGTRLAAIVSLNELVLYVTPASRTLAL